MQNLAIKNSYYQQLPYPGATPAVTKKQGRKDWKLTLVPTRDILATLGKRKKKKQILVGFAAETDRVTKNAREKLQTKGLDLIVVNNISKKGIGFGSSHNQVTVFFANGEKKTLPRLTKERLADRLLSLSLKGITRR